MRLYGEIIPGDYRPYRRTNYTLSHLYHNNQCRPSTLGVSRAKDWVSVDCGTKTCWNRISLNFMKKKSRFFK